ncbi:MAG: N-acetylneuraminate synthase [Lachnospiraceae bacterium]|nr:N-acetylneuraminate synthase [Lachnospiraceae bacterium]
MANKVLVIAEAGVNHNGSLDNAKKMIDAAADAGVDIIKFQTFKSEGLVTKNASKASYQEANTGNSDSQLSMLKKLELSEADHIELKKYCDQKGIEFLSTPFDNDSINFLDKLGIRFWKVPSGEITNYPYLVRIARTKKPVIMSTGMAELSEIRDAIDVLKSNGTSDISILHCNTQYPTPFVDVNLRVMNTLKETFGVEVGYSDHTLGIEVPIAAVAMGATIIEKHFTLDRNMEGPDHKASLEPYELKKMVESIRNIELAIGGNEKKPTLSESENRSVARKSIVAKCEISIGDIFTEDNLTTKRPGNGISPMRWNEILGKAATKNYLEDELIDE